MKKECNVHISPTDEDNPTRVHITKMPQKGKLVMHSSGGEFRKYLSMNFKPQHLYFTIDEEIKEGDIYLSYDKFYKYRGNDRSSSYWDERGHFHDDIGSIAKGIYSVKTVKETWRKIVATTNPKLHCTGLNREGTSCSKNNNCTFPDCGIAKIPQSFIKQYVDSQGSIKKVMLEYVDHGAVMPFMNVLTLNSSEEVIIHPLKQKMYTRKEVEDILSHWTQGGSEQYHSSKIFFDKYYAE